MIDAYLSRIGAAAAPVGVEALRDLQAAHLKTVPFENLSIHLGEPIVLDDTRLYDKIVHQWRGGFCFELNACFAWLLRQLGYRVSVLAARINDEPLGPLFDHLTLRVDLDEPWLVDVGVGRFTRYPLRLNDRGIQSDPEGKFQIVATENGDWDVHDEHKLRMRIESRPRELHDFTFACWWHQTSPDSPFTRAPTCSRSTDTARITLSGSELIHTVDGQRHATRLESPARILAAYREHFGLELEALPNDPRDDLFTLGRGDASRAVRPGRFLPWG